VLPSGIRPFERRGGRSGCWRVVEVIVSLVSSCGGVERSGGERGRAGMESSGFEELILVT
jgi:hypothetical protein